MFVHKGGYYAERETLRLLGGSQSAGTYIVSPCGLFRNQTVAGRRIPSAA